MVQEAADRHGYQYRVTSSNSDHTGYHLSDQGSDGQASVKSPSAIRWQPSVVDPTTKWLARYGRWTMAVVGEGRDWEASAVTGEMKAHVFCSSREEAFGQAELMMRALDAALPPPSKKGWHLTHRRRGDEEPILCCYCDDPTQGNYAIHRDGYGIGPEIPLCDACGSGSEPTPEEIWAHIRHVSINQQQRDEDDE